MTLTVADIEAVLKAFSAAATGEDVAATLAGFTRAQKCLSAMMVNDSLRARIECMIGLLIEAQRIEQAQAAIEVQVDEVLRKAIK